MKLLVVESPAKAKTINKYLGNDYKVVASFGHVRDLPSKKGSVIPEKDFELVYEVDAASKKHMKVIEEGLKNADTLILATDPDREGESISWHIVEELRKRKKLKKDLIIHRVAFNEITKKAIIHAVNNPREIDVDLVNAGQARRVLDYLVGFTLSPVLWKKLPGSRSAGRVQSVALRVICEREMDIEKFRAVEYWSITGLFDSDDKKEFSAKLFSIEGEKLDKFAIKNEEGAKILEDSLNGQDYSIKSLTSKTVKRRPQAPFITSTLQQDASNKLGFPTKITMSIAQKLYEGIAIAGETKGLITYMRTDGITISADATIEIQNFIKAQYGENYLPTKPYIYKSKVKNAQEAHEAIRPTDITLTPDSIKSFLSDEQFKLYSMIWKRTIASLMAEQESLQTSVEVESGDKKYILKATGSIIKFKGFAEIYDITQDESNILPNLKEGENTPLKKLETKQHFTEPPARYNEASLVKKMEELGIGRPSTYASIITVLQDRKYVRLEKRRFFTEERGMIVTAFLKNFFAEYVEYDFTANLENGLDDISQGKVEWKKFLDNFWQGFNKLCNSTLEIDIAKVAENITKELEGHYFSNEKGEVNRKCPDDGGELMLKLGKFGAFIACSNYPECKFTKQIATGEEAGGDAPANVEDKELGDGILLKKGPYGFYVETKELEKLKRVSIPKFIEIEQVDLPFAKKIIALPKKLGMHPENNKEILVNNGRYGPYVANNGKFASIENSDLFTIELEKAVALLDSSSKGAKSTGEVLGKHPKTDDEIKKMKGRYGPYIKYGKKNIALPKGTDAESLTLEDALKIIADKA